MREGGEEKERTSRARVKRPRGARLRGGSGCPRPPKSIERWRPRLTARPMGPWSSSEGWSTAAGAPLATKPSPRGLFARSSHDVRHHWLRLRSPHAPRFVGPFNSRNAYSQPRRPIRRRALATFCRLPRARTDPEVRRRVPNRLVDSRCTPIRFDDTNEPRRRIRNDSGLVDGFETTRSSHDGACSRVASQRNDATDPLSRPASPFDGWHRSGTVRLRLVVELAGADPRPQAQPTMSDVVREPGEEAAGRRLRGERGYARPSSPTQMKSTVP